MKLTKSKLKQIIQEELKAVLYEQAEADYVTTYAIADPDETPHICEGPDAGCDRIVGMYEEDLKLRGHKYTQKDLDRVDNDCRGRYKTKHEGKYGNLKKRCKKWCAPRKGGTVHPIGDHCPKRKD